MNEPTKYKESNALLCALENDDEGAREILSTMGGPGLRYLRDGCVNLRRLVDRELSRVRWEQENEDGEALARREMGHE